MTPAVSEFALIERHFRRAPRGADVRIGIGDDAAVVAPAPGMDLAVSVDMLVEGRHFFAGTDAESLGHKTLAVNLSDLAAMGARPRYALLAGALPEPDDAWLARFMRGFRALAAAHDVELIGGDTTRGPRNLCVTVIGEVPPGRAITRAGAQAGDDVYISGALGAAALAVRALRGDIALDAVALGLALREVASAGLDVSDGLLGDLAHVLDASHAGAVLSLALIPADAPVAALLQTADRALALDCLLAGGDDYELCFTAPRDVRAAVAAIARDVGVPCTPVGTIERERVLAVHDEQGRPLHPLPLAFDHFR